MAPVTVTLLTGDRVLAARPARRHHQVTVEPGAGRGRIQYLKLTDRMPTAATAPVVPFDAAPLLRAGRLDPAAVRRHRALIRHGYDDAAPRPTCR